MADDPTPSLTDLATQALRRAGETRAEDSSSRDAHLALLAATIRDERARMSRRRWIGASLAVAATIATCFGLRELASTPPRAAAVATAYEVRLEGVGAEIVRSNPGTGVTTSLRAGDQVRAGAEAVVLVVATGTKLTLEPGADLRVAEEGRTQTFALERGSVRADVAKLHDGERFIVRTADVDVEVRGTSFRVERGEASPCTPRIHTRVTVSEGVVIVRSAGAEARVTAGERWPLPCSPSSASESSVAPPPSAPPPAPSLRAPLGGDPSPPPSSASTLGAANELFARAEAARKHGDPQRALALFDRFLADYPASPLLEHATVERMRTLDLVDRGRAVNAARDYLARFPQGFARGEAEAIVAVSP